MSAAMPKCQIACSYCRGRKVRCSGGVRCRNCYDHGKECVYPTPLRKRRKKDGAETFVLEQRLAQVEALLQMPKGEMSPPGLEQTQALQSPTYLQPLAKAPLPSDHISPTQSATSERLDEERLNGRRDSVAPIRTHSPVFRRAQSTTGVSSMESYASASDGYRGPSTTTSPEMVVDKEESIIYPYNVNWEHHGPGSWLSICSYPGIDWVNERTEARQFSNIARTLTMGFTKRLKLDPALNREKASEPDQGMAWKYAAAYFDECHYAVFGVVYRPAFETRLRAQFAHPHEFEDDASWFALRNAVYASGCRVLLSKDQSVTFNEAQAQSWKYFENSLSVHTELLYYPTGLTAVQALALMSFYVEGLGSPTLEYMLCSNAARLAQSKGLHRHAARAWNLLETEILHLNWLFWAIYVCDKAIASRSGRPATLDDDNISCQIPTKVVSGSTIDIDIFTSAIKHAQISSQISKQLASVSAFHRTPLELIEKVFDLNQQLEDWRASLPSSLQPRAPRSPAQVSCQKKNIAFTYIQYAYYGSLMAIHTVFTYPWITVMFGPDPALAIREQVASSTCMAAEAARNIILSTRYIIMDATSPAWASFFFPMVGLINLFVSILKDPDSPTAQSDVALMDSAAGHFGHMEFITSSELAFPFTREIAVLARETVTRARDRRASGMNGNAMPLSVSDTVTGTSSANNGNAMDAGNPLKEQDPDPAADPWQDLHGLSAMDFDMESWNVFSMPMDDMSMSMGGYSGSEEVNVFR